MKLLTIELWSNNRLEYMNVLLTSLLSQTFKDWDITILEEYGNDYIDNYVYRNLLRLIKKKGHKIKYFRANKYLGNVKSAMKVMKNTKTKYGCKMDDDHILDGDGLYKLIQELEKDSNIGCIGPMLSPLSVDLEYKEEIPLECNMWAGLDKRIWIDCSTMNYEFPPKIIEVDFLRAPIIYRADKLRKTKFYEEYETLGYSDMAHRLESEIINTLKKNHNLKAVLNTGVTFWHYLAPSGGCREIDPATRARDDEIYYSRWKEFHKKRCDIK